MTVYFVSQKGNHDAPIKIGVTLDLDRRLSGLQTSSHAELEVIAALDGGRETETYLHDSLASARIRGEWFARTPEVLAAIKRARRVGPEALALSDPGLVGRAAPPGRRDDVEAARRLIVDLCVRIGNGDPQKLVHHRLWRLFEKHGYTFSLRRIRALHHNDARRVDHAEMVAIRSLIARLDEQDEARVISKMLPVVARILADGGHALSEQQRAIIEFRFGSNVLSGAHV